MKRVGMVVATLMVAGPAYAAPAPATATKFDLICHRQISARVIKDERFSFDMERKLWCVQGKCRDEYANLTVTPDELSHTSYAADTSMVSRWNRRTGVYSFTIDAGPLTSPSTSSGPCEVAPFTWDTQLF